MIPVLLLVVVLLLKLGVLLLNSSSSPGYLMLFLKMVIWSLYFVLLNLHRVLPEGQVTTLFPDFYIVFDRK